MMNEKSPLEVSSTIPDWSREAKSAFSWEPSLSLLASIRSYQRHTESRNPFRILLKKWAVIRHRFWSIVTGADIPLRCKIGGGLLLPHPSGIVIHPDVQIGPNCIIFQHVTIGVTYEGQTPPVIGGHVDIGASATILGTVRIGDHARIGAKALVLKDVPDGRTAKSEIVAKVY